MKVQIVYGSTTGNAQAVAEGLAGALGCAAGDVRSAAQFDAAAVEIAELLVLGSSTWGDGELQDDWQSALPALAKLPLQGKKVAVFGVGDASGWADTFVDAMRDLYNAAANAGATMIGSWPTEGYQFHASRAVQDGKFVGLAIDETNDAALTPERIQAWATQLQREAGV